MKSLHKHLEQLKKDMKEEFLQEIVFIQSSSALELIDFLLLEIQQKQFLLKQMKDYDYMVDGKEGQDADYWYKVTLFDKLEKFLIAIKTKLKRRKE